MTHSPEPWEFHENISERSCWKDWHAIDPKGRPAISFHHVLPDHEQQLKANLDRILACVNACQGLSTESLQMVAQGKASITTGRLGQHFVTAWPIKEPATIFSQADIPGLRK